MIDLFNVRMGWKDLARCVAEASEASRSGAAGKVLRAGWSTALYRSRIKRIGGHYLLRA